MVDRQTQSMIIDLAREYAAIVAKQYQLIGLYVFGSYAMRRHTKIVISISL